MHTTAGALEPSRELLALLRLARAMGKTLGEATLDVGAVNAIEAELGATLPDDALILMALRDPDLICATGLKIDSVLDAAEDWGKGLSEELVAIAHVYHDPFAARDEGVHGGEFEVIAIARAGDNASSKIWVNQVEETTVAAFAHDKLVEWLRRGEKYMQILANEKELPLEDPSFRPALTGALAEKINAPERFVAHPKFGRGRVFEEKTDGADLKLVIDFETAGRKTLLAKFVTEA